MGRHLLFLTDWDWVEPSQIALFKRGLAFAGDCLAEFRPKVLGKVAFVASSYEDGWEGDHQGWEYQAAAGAVAVEHNDTCSRQHLAFERFVVGVTDFTLFPQVLVGQNHFQIELQSAQNFTLVNADFIFKPLHFLLVERFSVAAHPPNHVVKPIAETFESTIHILQFASQQQAGRHHDETIVVHVWLPLEEKCRNMQAQSRKRVAEFHLTRQIYHELRVLARQQPLHLGSQSEFGVQVLAELVWVSQVLIH